MNPKVKVHLSTIRDLFEMLFEKFLNDIETKNYESVIFTHFLENMSDKYTDRHSSQEIVRDFLAGMTDQYFITNCPEHLRPKMNNL
jgi:dGTPase